jgi:hypothetical protein
MQIRQLTECIPIYDDIVACYTTRGRGQDCKAKALPDEWKVNVTDHSHAQCTSEPRGLMLTLWRGAQSYKPEAAHNEVCDMYACLDADGCRTCNFAYSACRRREECTSTFHPILF